MSLLVSELNDDECKYSCLPFFFFDLEFISFCTEMIHDEYGSNAILIKRSPCELNKQSFKNEYSKILKNLYMQRLLYCLCNHKGHSHIIGLVQD